MWVLMSWFDAVWIGLMLYYGLTLVKKKKKEHLRVFIKDVAQLLGLSKTAA